MSAPIQNVKGTTPTARLTSTLREVERVVISWGYEITLFYGSTTWPDHSNRRCGDIMTSSARKRLADGKTRGLTVDEQHELGDRIRAYLVTNAKRLGVKGIIWWRKVTGFPPGSYRGPEGVARPYSGPSAHVDHVHVEVAAGDYVPTKAVKPAKVYKLKITKGSIQGYDAKTLKSRGRRYKRGVGFTVVGTLIKLSDGYYIKTKHGTIYPRDNGNFAGYPKKG